MRKINREKMGKFVFNNISSENYDLVIEKLPSLSRPARKFSLYQVPGRNGDIIEQYDAYENITISYNVWFANNDFDSRTAATVAREIAGWLYNANGYCVLEDNFEPDVFRLAYFNGGLDIENELTKYGRATINFVCRPERFLKSGNKLITITSDRQPEFYTLYNPTSFTAKPLIKVTNNDELFDVMFYVNDKPINVRIDQGDYVYIDCFTQDCYRQPTENRNSSITGYFPLLVPKSNEIMLRSTHATLEIQPRFWTL